jgi:hypothetical protein
MTKLLVVCLICLFLAGCATSSVTYLPSGEVGYNITCSGTDLTWWHCYEKAGELCGSSGYDVVVRSDDKGASVVANQFGLYSGSTIQRNMLIKCGNKKTPNLTVTTSDSKKPMTSLTIDKKTVPFALIINQDNIHEDKIELSERWEKAGTTVNGLQLFIDNNTKSKPSEDIVRVWVKTIANTDNYTDLLEIDCVQHKIKKIDIAKESIAFADQTNEWKVIVPETASELIFNSVCLKE